MKQSNYDTGHGSAQLGSTNRHACVETLHIHYTHKFFNLIKELINAERVGCLFLACL